MPMRSLSRRPSSARSARTSSLIRCAASTAMTKLRPAVVFLTGTTLTGRRRCVKLGVEGNTDRPSIGGTGPPGSRRIPVLIVRLVTFADPLPAGQIRRPTLIRIHLDQGLQSMMFLQQMGEQLLQAIGGEEVGGSRLGLGFDLGSVGGHLDPKIADADIQLTHRRASIALITRTRRVSWS